MRLKIVSDGTVFGTQIIDVDTGEVQRNLHIKRIIIDAEAPTRNIQVEFLMECMPFDIEAEIE